MGAENLSLSIRRDSLNNAGVAVAEKPQFTLTKDYIFGPGTKDIIFSEEGRRFYGTLLNYRLWREESIKFKDGSTPRISRKFLDQTGDHIDNLCKEIGIEREQLETLGPQFDSLVKERDQELNEKYPLTDLIREAKLISPTLLDKSIKVVTIKVVAIN